MTLRDQFLAARDLAEEVVQVPEWGGTILLIEMDGESRLAHDDETSALKESETKETGLHQAARFLVRCVHDPATRERVFGDGDADLLMKKNHKVVMRLFAIAAKLNGASDKEVNEAAGKSEGAQPAG